MKSKYSKTTRQLLDEIRQNQIDETITAVKNKAKKTGMPYSILKKVYDRGMAAWKGGHRPGATQVQWALARVNSFVTKSSGTWGGADKDLAKKVRAAEEFEFTVCEKCGGEECVCEEFEKEELEEGKMSEIDRMSKDGKSAEEIAKALKLDVKAVKSVLGEADLSKKQIKMVHKVADDLPKKGFKDRYGKDKGDAVRFGTATNMVKKKLGIDESDAYDNDRFKIVGNTAKKDNSNTPDTKNHVYAPNSKIALQLHKQGKNVYREEKDINELTVSMDKVNKAQKIAKKFAGNMTKAVAEIEKIAKGLSNMSFVKQALAKYNEDLEKDDEKQVKDVIKGLKKGSALHAKQAKELEKQIADEVELEEKFTKKDFKDNERNNEHGLNAKKVVDMFGTSAEKMKIDAINARHNMKGSISREDQMKRDAIVRKYYNKLKESSWEKNKDTIPPHLRKLFDDDGNLKNPRSRAVFDKMIKDAGGPEGFKKKFKLKEDISEAGPCWKGFKQVGMKKKGGKMVPNCVPTEDTDYDFKVLDLEDLDENLDVRYDIKKQGWFDKQGKRRYLGIGQTNALMKKALDKAKRTGDFINPFKMTHGQKAEDLDAQPQDKDVKKVKGTQPKKYYKDLKKDTKKKRANFFKNRPGYKKSDDDDDYKAAPGDKEAKTKPSTFTKKFKKMYGEEQLNEFTAAQIKTLEREYAPLKGRRMSPEQLNKMTGMIKKMTKDQLNKLAQASIPFVTSTAKSELVINRGMKWTDFKEGLKNESADKETTSATVSKKTDDKEKLKQEIEKLEKENQLLKVKNLEKSQKTVEPNKDTGEVPLKVGLAQKIIKDMRDGKKYKMKEKETTKLKVGTGKTKIEIDPKMDISASAGGNAQAASNN